jgi:hypothetical protein
MGGSGTLGLRLGQWGVAWPVATSHWRAQRSAAPRRSQLQCILLPRRHVSSSRWRRARCAATKGAGAGREREREAQHGKDARRALWNWAVASAQPGRRGRTDDGPIDEEPVCKAWGWSGGLDGRSIDGWTPRTPTRPCSLRLCLIRLPDTAGIGRRAPVPWPGMSLRRPYRDDAEMQTGAFLFPGLAPPPYARNANMASPWSFPTVLSGFPFCTQASLQCRGLYVPFVQCY